jgi:anti-anti-sigma factor
VNHFRLQGKLLSACKISQAYPGTTDVSAIDSAGIGELVRAYILVKSRGGEMRLLNPTKKVSDRLDLTRLLRVIEVFTDEALALRGFDLNIHIFEDAQIAISL